MLVRHCLIELCVLFFRLEYALLYLLHLFAVGLLRLLPLVVLLHRLHIIAAANARVLMQESTLGGVRQLQFRRRTLRKLCFLPLLLGHKVISCNRPWLGPSCGFFLLRLIECISSRIVEDLLALGYKLAFPFLRFPLPDS